MVKTEDGSGVIIKRWMQSGFTIVELLIVIVIIGILAAITVVAYNGVQKTANESKMKSDLGTLDKAIRAARINEAKVLRDITGVYYTASACTAHPVGTDLAALPRGDDCWVDYLSTMDKISTASGINVRGLVDPWGRPYVIDENETEGSGLNTDLIGAYAESFNGSSRYPGISLRVPHSGY